MRNLKARRSICRFFTRGISRCVPGIRGESDGTTARFLHGFSLVPRRPRSNWTLYAQSSRRVTPRRPRNFDRGCEDDYR